MHVHGGKLSTCMGNGDVSFCSSTKLSEKRWKQIRQSIRRINLFKLINLYFEHGIEIVLIMDIRT